MNINTAIYVRVSTEEQALNGFSIRAQKEKLMYYATKIKDWNVYKVYSDEGISGKDIKNRPSLQEMLTDIKNKKVNNVLVFKIDRLTRSTKDLIDLIKNPSWEKFSEVLADISFILAGIGLVVGGPTGIKMAILGAILTIVGAVIQNWDTIKETLDKILPFINLIVKSFIHN